MTQPQSLYLLLACASFLLFGISLAAATLQYSAWKRRTGGR